MLQRWAAWARRLKSRVRAVYFAYSRYALPWYTKLVAFLVLAYAISPIDLIPDFIPVLGYLDDLIILPLGIALVIRLIPQAIWKVCMDEAESEVGWKYRWLAAIPIVLLWIGGAALLLHRIAG